MGMIHQLDALASFIWNNALIVFVIVWVHEGTRILAIGGQRRRGIKVLILGVLPLLFLVSIQFWVSHTMRTVGETLALPPHIELPTEWGADMASEKRESSSRAYASTVFARSGELVHYFDRSGGWKLYCPTKEDIASRDQTVAVQSQLEQVEKGANSAAYGWLVFGFVAALVGWATGRKEWKKLANPAVDRSA